VRLLLGCPASPGGSGPGRPVGQGLCGGERSMPGAVGVVSQREPWLGPGPVGGQAQDGSALWSDESGGHVDQLSA
jgi:hypothetical protein